MALMSAPWIEKRPADRMMLRSNRAPSEIPSATWAAAISGPGISPKGAPTRVATPTPASGPRKNGLPMRARHRATDVNRAVARTNDETRRIEWAGSGTHVLEVRAKHDQKGWDQDDNGGDAQRLRERHEAGAPAILLGKRGHFDPAAGKTSEESCWPIDTARADDNRREHKAEADDQHGGDHHRDHILGHRTQGLRRHVERDSAGDHELTRPAMPEGDGQSAPGSGDHGGDEQGSDHPGQRHPGIKQSQPAATPAT